VTRLKIYRENPLGSKKQESQIYPYSEKAPYSSKKRREHGKPLKKIKRIKNPERKEGVRSNNPTTTTLGGRPHSDK